MFVPAACPIPHPVPVSRAVLGSQFLLSRLISPISAGEPADLLRDRAECVACQWISCGKGLRPQDEAPASLRDQIWGFGPPGASTRCGARPVHERICRYPELRGDCLETRLNIIALMYALKTRSQGSCGLLSHGHTAANPIQASVISRRQTGRGLWYTEVRQKEMLRLRAR